MEMNDINRIIDADYNEFYTAIYDGEVPVPKDLMNLFRLAIMAVSPNDHKMQAYRIRELNLKKVHELTWVETGAIINLILAVPFRDMYRDLGEALKKTEELQKFMGAYNAVVANLDTRLRKKKQTLIDLGGHKKGPPRLITAQA